MSDDAPVDPVVPVDAVQEAGLSFGTAVLAAGLGALALRLAVGLLWPLEPVADAADYDALARGLARGAGFDGAFRPPLYPLFVASVYRTFGESAVAVRAAQAVLDTGTCLVVALWAGSRLGSRAGLVTLALGAVSMSAVAATRVLLSEVLAAFLLTAVTVLFHRALVGREPHSASASPYAVAAAVGIAAGALTLTRGIMLLLPVALTLALVSVRRFAPEVGPAPGRPFRLAAVLLLSYGLTLAPWLARNQARLGAPVLTTQVGITFYSSHFRDEGQPYGVLTDDAVTRGANGGAPVEVSRRLVRATVDRLRGAPLVAVTAYPGKLVNLFAPVDYEVMGGRRVNWTYLLVVVLTVFGFPAVYRRDPSFAVAAVLPLLYLSAIALPFYGSPRFRLPAEPLLVPLAAAGAIKLGARFRRPGRSS